VKCGNWKVLSTASVSAQAPCLLDELPWYESAIEDEYLRVQQETRELLRQKQRRERLAEQTVRDAEWQARYSEYLKSDAWQAKRVAALARDAGVCRGCGRHKATQVHHKTYAHVGREFLFELEALCDACHQRVHNEGPAW